MSNKEKNNFKIVKGVVKAIEIGAALTDLHGHRESWLRVQEQMNNVRHERMWEAQKKTLTPHQMALEKMNAFKAAVEAGNAEHEKEKMRRLEQQKREALAGDFARSKGVITLDNDAGRKKERKQEVAKEKARKMMENKIDMQGNDRQLAFERRKNIIEKKQKETSVQLIQKKKNEHI